LNKITATIDGTEYELRLDLAAMKDFEDQSRKNIFVLIQNVIGAMSKGALSFEEGTESRQYMAIIPEVIKAADLSMTELGIFVWACFGGRQAPQTIEAAIEITGLDADTLLRYPDKVPQEAIASGIYAAGRLASIQNIAVLYPAIGAAIEQALPKSADGEGEQGADPTSRPTGTTSGPSGDTISDSRKEPFGG